MVTPRRPRPRVEPNRATAADTPRRVGDPDARLPDARLCIGAIAGPHGVRGQVKIRCFTEDPASLRSFGEVFDADGRPVGLQIRQVRENQVIANIDGVRDRAAAEALRGRELFVARAALPTLDDDEFYHADLIGLPVERADGRRFGTVRAMHNFGAGDLIEIAGLDGRPVVLAFNREVVPVVDIPGRRIVVVPPATMGQETEP